MAEENKGREVVIAREGMPVVHIRGKLEEPRKYNMRKAGMRL